MNQNKIITTAIWPLGYASTWLFDALVSCHLSTKRSLLLVTFLFSELVQAAEPVSKSKLNGVAIGGHDSVAYHQLQADPQDKAVGGDSSFVVEYKGAKWRFASQASADKFAADPDKYSPAYNGHCANALSLGHGLVPTDGTHWEIFSDQLYLFFAARGRDRWLDGGWAAYKADADAAWEKLKLQ